MTIPAGDHRIASINSNTCFFVSRCSNIGKIQRSRSSFSPVVPGGVQLCHDQGVQDWIETIQVGPWDGSQHAQGDEFLEIYFYDAWEWKQIYLYENPKKATEMQV